MIEEFIDVIIFDNEEWISAGYWEDADGVYFSDDNTIVLRREGDDDFDSILVHEITHFLSASYPYVVYDLTNDFYKSGDVSIMNNMNLRTELFDIIINDFKYPNDLETLRYEHDANILQANICLNHFLDIIENYYGIFIDLNFIE